MRWQLRRRGIYPDPIGHRNFSGGCFRCRSNKHEAEDGTTVSQDCSVCHQTPADAEYPEALEPTKPYLRVCH